MECTKTKSCDGCDLWRFATMVGQFSSRLSLPSYHSVLRWWISDNLDSHLFIVFEEDVRRAPIGSSIGSHISLLLPTFIRTVNGFYSPHCCVAVFSGDSSGAPILDAQRSIPDSALHNSSFLFECFRHSPFASSGASVHFEDILISGVKSSLVPSSTAALSPENSSPSPVRPEPTAFHSGAHPEQRSGFAVLHSNQPVASNCSSGIEGLSDLLMIPRVAFWVLSSGLLTPGEELIYGHRSSWVLLE
ncbi:hypothetical protein FNV43_RR22746 [Rhamnella rubrinervis]|uniref:Uncharacterized protein n=1 Tax=Rhamnella rubrinervis TaxID=2594499 RepID=A0A8K0GVG0_9ROSA|nr:hypothetical protein FNV43_RR22746 [Rhamnella rubrinervis]